MIRHSRRILLSFFLMPACLYALPAYAQQTAIPPGFVYVEDFIPDIKIDLRYYSKNNFVGERIDGYLKPRCILTKEAAAALKGVQEDLKPFGLGLKIFDAYRPRQAVAHFVRWAKDIKDTRMKKRFYPKVDKANLFRDEYIAEKSGHSRGSTVDITIINLSGKNPGAEIDMGTGFDFFGPESRPENPTMSPAQHAHRLLLKVLMDRHDFNPYPMEWWHFTLRNEPFPETYFDFPVQ